MTAEQEKTVVIALAPNSFLAETIAGALRERGIDARVLDGATTQAWGMPMGTQGGVKVVVLEHEREAAELALSEIRVESSSIDWDSVDVGEDEAGKLAQHSRARRWMWTVAVLLVPVALFVLAFGVDRGDATIKLLGGTLLATALVLAIYQFYPEREG